MVNDRSTGRRPRHLLLGVIAVLALLLAACGNSDDDSSGGDAGGTTTTSSGDSGGSGGDAPVKVTGVPGVTDSEIKFSSLGTNSNNPLGTCVLDCFDQGVKAYFAYRNSTGGVHGRDLVLSKEVDDELSNNQPKALEIVSANDTFGTFSAAQLASGWGDLAKAGVPTYVWMINPAEAAGHPEIFGNREVVCITCTSRTAAWGVKLAKGKKVAELGYGVSENSKQCADWGAKTIEKYGKDIGGAKSVYTASNLDFGLPNGVGPQVTAMKQAGVDTIIGCLDLNGMKTVAQEMQRQGIRDDVTMIHANTYDQKFVDDADGLFDGDLIGVAFRPFEADAGDSGLKQFKEWMEKEDYPISEIAMNGWINATLAAEGIEAAGPNFDRQKVVDATNKIKSFTAGGLTMPVEWGRQHEPPTEDDITTHGPASDCTSYVRVGDGGKFELEGDKAKPFICFPGESRDWSTPEDMNFK